MFFRMSNRPESALAVFSASSILARSSSVGVNPSSRLEQIIRKDGVKQVIKGRFSQKVTEIIMLLCIHDQGFFCGQLVNGNQGFRVKGRGGGGIRFAATVILRNSPRFSISALNLFSASFMVFTS